MPYRSDLEEMSGGNRYSAAPKKAKPKGFFENEVASTPFIVLFMFTTCCVPFGLIVTAVVWGTTKDPGTRRRARIATLFPVGIIAAYLVLMLAISFINFVLDQ